MATTKCLVSSANDDPESQMRMCEFAPKVATAKVAMFNELSNAAYGLAALHAFEPLRFTH